MRIRGPKPRVVIERSGGDLRVIMAPAGVVLEIHDYDTPEDGRALGPTVIDPETLEEFEVLFISLKPNKRQQRAKPQRKPSQRPSRR